MNHRRLAATVVTALAISGAPVMLGGTGALADPPSNGCPSGYQLLSVATLTAEGYKVPALVDSPTGGVDSFGKPGNGDGWVCGVQLGNQLTSFGEPIYNFIDDQLPAS